jgi:DNA-directed RNA polymerase specialized sigma24 family protein
MNIEQHYRENYNRYVQIVLRKLDRKYRSIFLAEEIVQEAYTEVLQYPSDDLDKRLNETLNSCLLRLIKQERNRGMTQVGDTPVWYADFECVKDIPVTE